MATALVTLAEYGIVLASELGQGFALGELVRAGSRRHRLPPRPFLGNMLPTLRLANTLRRAVLSRDVDAHGPIIGPIGTGLAVAAAYRPEGGAKGSRHKWNQAIDLDLLGGSQLDHELAFRRYYRAAVLVWYTAAASGLRVGLGLYCNRDRCAGRRVHLDVGFKTRTWQHGWDTETSDALLILRELGLPDPR